MNSAQCAIAVLIFESTIPQSNVPKVRTGESASADPASGAVDQMPEKRFQIGTVYASNFKNCTISPATFFFFAHISKLL